MQLKGLPGVKIIFSYSESVPTETKVDAMVSDDTNSTSDSADVSEGTAQEDPTVVADCAASPPPEAKLVEVKSKEWTVEEIQRSSRKFNIDLSPKVGRT
jgi:hypothetical protein